MEIQPTVPIPDRQALVRGLAAMLPQYKVESFGTDVFVSKPGGARVALSEKNGRIKTGWKPGPVTLSLVAVAFLVGLLPGLVILGVSYLIANDDVAEINRLVSFVLTGGQTVVVAAPWGERYGLDSRRPRPEFKPPKFHATRLGAAVLVVVCIGLTVYANSYLSSAGSMRVGMEERRERIRQGGEVADPTFDAESQRRYDAEHNTGLGSLAAAILAGCTAAGLFYARHRRLARYRPAPSAAAAFSASRAA